MRMTDSEEMTELIISLFDCWFLFTVVTKVHNLGVALNAQE